MLALDWYNFVEKSITYLITSGSEKATSSRLDSASGRVDVRLESGGLLVRHVDWFVGIRVEDLVCDECARREEAKY